MSDPFQHSVAALATVPASLTGAPPPPAPHSSWRQALPVALEGSGFAVPITVGAVAVLFARIDPSLMPSGLLAALVGMVIMQAVTARAGRPMVYMVRVLEAATLLGFLDHFILKMPGWGLADTPAHRLMLVIAVSIGAALLLPLGHMLRLQRFARMIPMPVFAGFSTALALTLLISQSVVLWKSLPVDGAWFAAVAVLVLGGALLAQRFAERWPPGVIGLVLGSMAAFALAAAGGHALSNVMHGELALAFPITLVHWPDLWAPQVDTAGVLRDVVLASGTMAFLVFLNTVVNEEAVTQLDDAQSRPRDWLRSSGGVIAATLLGCAPLTASIGPTRAAVRVGRIEWRAMALMALLTLAVLGSGVLTLVPLAGICGLLLLDASNSFDRPSARLALQAAGKKRRLVSSEKEDLLTIGLVVVTAVVFNMVVGIFVGVFAGLVLYAWRNGRRLARTVANGESVRSNCSRSASDAARLALNAQRVRFVALEGALFFGAARALQALLRGQATRGNYVVVDWSHVVSADSTVASAFVRAVSDARAAGAHMAVSGLDAGGPQLGETLRAAGLDAPVFPDADRALEWAENEAIGGVGGARGMNADVTGLQEALTLLKGLSPAHRDALEPLFEQRFFSAGETVFLAGQHDSELMVILQGSVDILVPHRSESADRNVRLARIRRGAMLGELSFLDSSVRAATAVATEDLLVGVLSREAFEAFAQQEPDAARRVLANLALDLAFRLRRTNQMAVGSLR